MARLVLAYLRRPVQMLAVLGVAIGLLALLVVLSVMNGLIEKDRANARGPLSDLLLLPAVTAELPRYEDYRAALEAVPEVTGVAPHLVAYAVLGLKGRARVLYQTRSSDINGVQVVGIDPEAEAAVTGFEEALARAGVAPVSIPADPFDLDNIHGLSEDERFFARPGILLSDSLASTLGIPTGERLNLGSLPPVLDQEGTEFQPHWGEFWVTGTYASLDYELDMDRIYLRRTGRDGLRYNLLGSDSAEFTEILIKLAPGVSFADGKGAVRAGLAAAGLPEPGGPQGGALQSWEERRIVYLTAIENERRVTGLVMFFIVIVAAFGLFATLSALVREKVRDLGVLSALGFSPARRAGLLLAVGATGSAVGTALGLLGGWWFVRHHEAVEAFLADRLGIEIFPAHLYVIEGLPALWIPSQAFWLAGAAFLVGCLFTLAPALRAASLSPSEALRYE